MSLKKKKWIFVLLVIRPFSSRDEPDFICIACDLEDGANHKVSEVPLWTTKSPTYNHYLASDKKATTNQIFFFFNKFLEVKEQFYIYEEFSTDGSKDGERSCFSLPSLTVNYISSVYLIIPLSSLRS